MERTGVIVINSLVEIVDNKIVVSSRMIAERFGKRHDNILRAIIGMECSAEFAVLNFEVSTYKDASGKTNIEYLVTRDGFSFLVMGFTGQEAAYWKERYIKAFNDMEAELNRPKLPTTFAEALRLAATQAEQLEAARPKVEFVDTYVEKGDCVCLRELGKKLGKRPTKFQELLRNDGYLTSKNLPYQKHIASGLFEVKTVTEYGKSQTVATPKAITFFAEKYKDIEV